MTLTRRKSDSDGLPLDRTELLPMAKMSTSNRSTALGRRKRLAPVLVVLVCLGFLAGFILIFNGFFDETIVINTGSPEDSQPIQRDSPPMSESIGHRRLKTDQMQSYRVRLEELSNIKASVLRELRALEQKRHQLRSEITTVSAKLEFFQTALERREKELDQLRSSIEQAKLTKREALEQDTPVISAPNDFQPEVDRPMVSHTQPTVVSAQHCSMEKCFDHSRCSILSKFPVFIHRNFVDLSSSQLEFLQRGDHVTDQVDRSCLFIVPIWISSVTSGAALISRLSRLPTWGGDGRNHVILPLIDKTDADPTVFWQLFSPVRSRAILVSSFVDPWRFRPQFDVSNFLFTWPNQTAHLLPPLSPAKRNFLLSFWSEPSCNRTEVSQLSVGLRQLQIAGQKTKDKFYFSFSCAEEVSNVTTAAAEDTLSPSLGRDCWTVCESAERRAELLKQSIFTLIPISDGSVNPAVTRRLVEALMFGSIPLFLGEKSVEYRLPFSEIFDWKTVGLFIPLARLPETHFLLRTFVDTHIIQFRTSGRRAYELFLSSNRRIFDTLLSVLRTRLNIPPLVVKDFVAEAIFNETIQPKTTDMPFLSETDEFLGPVELPYDSPKFVANYSTVTLKLYESWNNDPYPFALFPHNPIAEEVLPSEAKFTGSNYGFRPINSGSGGSGKEFSESLGGNNPREQFTIVMLTYEREEVLVTSLQRLNNLPYLNKVVVVWNSPKSPSPELVWPKLNAEVVVVRTGKNSLNNRFLPYELINTEAILSLDDDAHLRHDEIIFGFRVWREARDRIVGFPGRFHAWDEHNKNWLYNSNHSCELSMVLTGAAFFHKYYSYIYSYYMPEAIRLKVDELMNCEDIAMNFLVSHITRAPPLKVTSRWTFRCPGCPESLSSDDSHFFERHECINFFVKIYGYNPLLYTQFRIDSVLFKTRLPHNHQKCFKFI